MAAVLGRDEHGKLIRKAGVMGIVVDCGGMSRQPNPNQTATGATSTSRAGLTHRYLAKHCHVKLTSRCTGT